MPGVSHEAPLRQLEEIIKADPAISPNVAASDVSSPVATPVAKPDGAKAAVVAPVVVAPIAVSAPEVKQEPHGVAGKSVAADQDALWDIFKNKYPDFANRTNENSTLKRRPSSENVTLQQYADKHKARFDRVLELEGPGGWTLKLEQSGVNVYTKAVEGSKLLYFKSQTTIPCENMAILMDKLFDTTVRPKWDEMCLDGKILEKASPFYRVFYAAIKAPSAIIANRDLVGIGRFRFEGENVVVATLQSIEHASMPEKADFVRINFVEGGYVLRDRGNGTFEVTYTACVDPKGWLPTFVANSVCAKQGITLVKLKEYIASSSKPSST